MGTTKKVWWKSITLWVNALVIAGAFHPAVTEWVHQDPRHNIQLLALWNILQRFATRKPVGTKDEY